MPGRTRPHRAGTLPPGGAKLYGIYATDPGYLPAQWLGFRAMRFIRGVRVTDFRSLPKVELSDLDNVIPIVGPNGSGKSNLLRALNLFFNGRVEAESPLDLGRDFHNPTAKRRKKKKQVEVALDLDFGTDLREELKAPITDFADSAAVVTIRKRWSLDPSTDWIPEEVAMGPAGGDLTKLVDADRAAVQRLLASIRFRYISNHTHPTDLLRQEQENIRRVLFRRLGKSPSFTQEQITKIRDSAASLMNSVSEELARATGRASTVELGTPKDWGELLWAFGLWLQDGDSAQREAVLHGSGIQSVLAYAVLHTLDTSLGNEIGWRRGAIWAVEEPESFLHADLQAQLAESFSRYSNSNRLQILFTTHNTAFLGVADTGVSVRTTGLASEVAHEPRTKLIDMALSSGVSPYAHPLHIGTIKPLLLVEGRHDRDLLLRAYADSGDACPYDVKAMRDLEPTTAGGVDQIQTYLSSNRSALRARPASSPVLVLLDHEVSAGRRNSLSRVLSDHPTSACHTMPQVARTAGLKDTIAGIEAYLSLDFYRAASAEIGLAIIHPSDPIAAGWSIGVEKSELGRRKQDLHEYLARRANPDDIVALRGLVPWVSQLYAASGQTALPV